MSLGAGGAAQQAAVGLPALPQDEVVVGSGAHGIEDVGLLRDEQLWGRRGIISLRSTLVDNQS